MKKQIRDQIIQALAVIEYGIRNMKTAKIDATKIKKWCETLNLLVRICQAELSAERAMYYSQIFNGVMQSFSDIEGFLGGTPEIEEICELMSNLLCIAINELRNEKEVKKEILFLPYKASMWDSLESIWLAAKEDSKHCDAYVIPIPYCDRKTNGEAAQWHCEANEFPAYVPVTDWREYDIAKRRPDVIYIHNPYDGYNYVTSVHPAFYASELKKHTDMLVYVPYFITDGEHVAPHYCSTLGVVYADRVIVQNDAIKQQYIENYPDRNASKEFLDKKFLALGSPKIEKVLRSKREDFELPQAWKNKLQGKKAILYNTHLGRLIEDPGQQIKKIRDVFDVFRKNGDIVLWWRPHPLSEATVQSMRPDALVEYKNLEEEYKRDDFGIFDDTANLHRAICWTDAYYGDMSSVVWLYKVTGKKILIQTMEREKMSRYDYAISFMDCIVDGDTIWVSANNLNGLFRIDLKDFTPHFICHFPNVDKRARCIHGACTQIGDELIFAPLFGNNYIHFYSLKTGKCEAIKVSSKKGQGYSCTCMLVANDEVYFFPCSRDDILILNLRSRQIEWLNDFRKPLEQGMDHNAYSYFNYGAQRYKNNIFIPCSGMNAIVKIDIETHKQTIIKVGKKGNRYGNMAMIGEDMYLLLLGKEELLQWNIKTGFSMIYSLASGEKDENPIPFLNMVALNGKIYIAACLRKKSLIFNISTKEKKLNSALLQRYRKVKLKLNFGGGDVQFYMLRIIDNHRYIAVSALDNCIRIVDPTNGKVWSGYAGIKEAYCRRLCEVGIEKREEQDYTLNDYIINVLKFNRAKKETTTANITCGRLIYGETIDHKKEQD